MNSILLGIVPALALAWVIGIEIPESWRRALFVDGLFGKWRPPLFLITLSYGFFVKASLEGVLGSYGIFLTDILLYPLLLLISIKTKWAVKRAERKVSKYGTESTP